MPTMELVQEKTIDEAIRVFNTHDKEAKGWITTAQSVRVFQEISAKLPFQAEPRDLVADVDPQATGKVQFPDFVLLISRRALERADTELHDAFRTFHSDHGEHKRGLLSAPLIRHVLSVVDTHHVDRIDKECIARVLELPEQLTETTCFNYNEVLSKHRTLRDPTPFLEEVFATEE